MMTLDELDDGLDRHGSDLASWPELERDAAQALLAGSARARAHHAAALGVDSWLRGTSERRPPSDDRIAAVAMRRPQAGGAGVPAGHDRKLVRASGLRPVWLAAAALVALASGVAAGGLAPARHEDGPGQLLASALEQTASVDAE